MSDFIALFDVQTLTIWATVVAVSAATIYAIMNLLMKEKSYEDVVLEQTGKVVKHTSKPIPKKPKKNKQAKQQGKKAELVNSKPVSSGDNEVVIEQPIVNSVQPVQAEKAKVNNKNKKRSDKDIASGKGLSSVALQIHDLIQELLLSESDTEILVDELTRFSPKLREKYAKSSKPIKKNENKQKDAESDNFLQMKKDIDGEKQKNRISEKLIETLSLQIKSLSQTSETNKKLIQSLKNETESFRSKEKIPDQREIVKSLHSEINELNKQVDQQKAKTKGIDVGNMKKQLEIITGELTKSALKMNAAENGKKIFEKKSINLQKKIETLESSLAQKNEIKSKDNDSLLNEINTLRAKYHESESRLNESQESQAKTKQEINHINTTHEIVIKENKHKTKNLEDLMIEKTRISNDLKLIQNDFTCKSVLLTSTTEQLQISHQNIDKINSELTEQRTKNDVLRTRNSSVLESLSAIEKENLILKSDIQKSKTSSKSSEDSEKELSKLREVHSEIVSSNKEQSVKFQDEIKIMTTKINTLEKNSSSFDNKTKELLNNEDKVKKELNLLKEKMLSLMKDNQELKKNTESLDTTNFEKVIQELQVKENQLKSDIVDSNNEKKKLEGEIELGKSSNETLNNELANYKKVLNNTESVLQKLQDSVESEEQIWKDKLEKEKSSSGDQVKTIEKEMKSLHSENVKLNGVIKTGKDALDAEQKITNELKEKINKSSSNGLTEDHAKTKKRLAIVESLLENERSNNKILSAKLGA